MLLWVWMVVDFVLQGEYTNPWAWIVLLSPVGGMAYFVCFYLPRVLTESPQARSRKRFHELQALRSRGLTADQQHELGDLYRGQRRWLEAIACYQEALKGFPGRAATRIDLAECFVESGRAQDAVSELEAVMTHEGFYKERAALLLSHAFLKLGKRQEALVVLQPLYHSNGSAELSYQFVVCLDENGRREDARSVLNNLLSRSVFLQRADRAWVSAAKARLRKIR